MTVAFDLDFVTFRCRHPKCAEIFEKSADEIAKSDEVICPRCGTAASVDEDNPILAAG